VTLTAPSRAAPKGGGRVGAERQATFVAAARRRERLQRVTKDVGYLR
jgi:hypothetical protein